MPQRSVAHPVVARAAQVVPATINETDHTVEVVFTTGAQVRRADWIDGAYLEELEVSEAAVDLSRLLAGAPFLDSHRSWEIDAIRGVTETAWIKNNEGRARIRVDVGNDEGKELWRKIKAGLVRFVSVGYIVNRFVETMRDGMRVLRAVRWTPVEISAVAVPADAGAAIRNAADTSVQCVIESETPPEQERGMPTPPDPNTPTPPTAPPAGDDTAARAAAEAAARTAEILDLCSIMGRSVADAQKLIASARSVTDIRKEFVDARAAGSDTEVRGHQPGGIPTGGDAKPGALRERMAGTLQQRGITPAAPINQGA